MRETPFFLMFGRKPRLPASICDSRNCARREHRRHRNFCSKRKRKSTTCFWTSATKPNRTCREASCEKLKITAVPCLLTWSTSTDLQTIPGNRRTTSETDLAVAWTVHSLLAIVTGCIRSEICWWNARNVRASRPFEAVLPTVIIIPDSNNTHTHAHTHIFLPWTGCVRLSFPIYSSLYCYMSVPGTVCCHRRTYPPGGILLYLLFIHLYIYFVLVICTIFFCTLFNFNLYFSLPARHLPGSVTTGRLLLS